MTGHTTETYGVPAHGTCGFFAITLGVPLPDTGGAEGVIANKFAIGIVVHTDST